MNSLNHYTRNDEYAYIPFVYQITLTKGSETKHYIGSKCHQTPYLYLDDNWYPRANPQLFIEGLYNGEGLVNDYLEMGWDVTERKIIETFEGTIDGARAAGKMEGDILKEVDAAANELYLNKHNRGFRWEHKSDATRKLISDAHTGRVYSDDTRKKKSLPFALHVELPDGSRETYTYEINSMVECRKQFGISGNTLTLLKYGDTYIVKTVRKSTRHPWPVGTKVTAEIL